MTPAGTPACPLGQICTVISLADDGKIGLDVATQTQIRVPGDQHLVRNRTMHFMAGCASFTQRFMLPDKRTALVFMTFETGFINIFRARRRPGPRVNTMEVMTIGATHLALQDRMAIGETEFCLLLKVAGKTDLRFLPGV